MTGVDLVLDGAPMVELSEDGAGVLVPVKVVPGASHTRIMGELGGRLKVAVAAQPEKGKANDALTAFLANQLGLRHRAVAVVSGMTSPLKTVRIAGATIERVRESLLSNDKG